MEEIFIPASGMAAEDVLVSEWLKQPGDEVAAGEPVAVVETDKATVELSGTTPGRLSRHLVEAGARVPGGTTVAYLLDEGELEPGAAPATNALDGETGSRGGTSVPPAATTAPSVARAPIPNTEVATPKADGQPPLMVPADKRRPDGRHTLSPRQRRAMTGPGSPARVKSVADSTVPTTAIRGDRQATSALVTESWRTVPHFSVGRDVRADGLLEAVSAARAAGTAVTVTDFLALSLARALRAVGELPDLGLAVATDWGVLIPVLRSLDGRSLAEVAALREVAVGRARSRRLNSGDGTAPFATLSNLGPDGVTWFTGVVPVNQVALLTVGQVTLRPAVEGRGLVVAPMFTAIVTADHRRYDGVDSAKLLTMFVEQLSNVIEEGLA